MQFLALGVCSAVLAAVCPSPNAFNISNFQISYGDLNRYKVRGYLGKGHFSVVYGGWDTQLNREVALKFLTLPVRDNRIKHEILALQALQGAPNTIQLFDIVRDNRVGVDVLVFELVPQTENYHTLFEKFNDWETRFYLYEALKSLAHAHAMGIIHRDVKPGNIVFDRANMKVRVCDWGLASFVHQEGKPSTAGLRPAKSPERLFLSKIDASNDMWLFGLTVISAVFLVNFPPFRAASDQSIALNMMHKMGSKGARRVIEKYGLGHKLAKRRPLVHEAVMHHNAKRRSWSEYVREYNIHLCSPEVFDLLNHLITWDSAHRYTAAEALKHPYFAPIRECEDGIPDPKWSPNMKIQEGGAVGAALFAPVQDASLNSELVSEPL